MQPDELGFLGLATFQEFVMGDAALPVGIEDGAWMKLMRLAEAGVLLFTAGLRLAAEKWEGFDKLLVLHF